MTIVIAGIAVVSLLYGLGAAINLSGVDRSRANLRTLLTNSVESVKNQPYVACPGVNGSSYNPTSGVNVPSGWYITISDMYYWNGTAFQQGCPPTDQKLQLIYVKAQSPDGRTKDALGVVKRSGS